MCSGVKGFLVEKCECRKKTLQLNALRSIFLWMQDSELTIGERLKKAIGVRSPRAIAAKAGYTVTYINQLCSGVRCPTFAAVKRLAEATGVKEPWLAYGVGKPSYGVREDS